MGAGFRWVLIVHRYIGIGLCLLMLLWCVSGAVMVYVPYPSLSESQRLSGLAPLDWNKFSAVRVAGPFSLEMMHDRLLLKGSNLLTDLSTGKPAAAVTPDDARAVAQLFARNNGLSARDLALDQVTSDQWTVGGFRRDKPLYRVQLKDAADTYLYVSSTSGRVVQSVTASQRFWNYFGAVPHWLYFTQLRAQPVLWAQIIVWTSLFGGILVAAGMYLGIWQWWKARRVNRVSTYGGIVWWHHVPGLIFGLFLLTWVVSGWLSMNPWGLLESMDTGDEVALLSGNPLVALPRLSGSEFVSLEPAPLNGQSFFVAARSDGTRQRLDGNGQPVALTQTDIAFIAHTLTGDTARRPDILTDGDDYYFSHGNENVPLPVWRYVLGNGDRYYLDPVSGILIGKMDSASRGYRWWFQGLHRWDFNAPLRARPGRDIWFLTLLAGAAFVSATGGWLGWRYLTRRGPKRA